MKPPQKPTQQPSPTPAIPTSKPVAPNPAKDAPKAGDPKGGAPKGPTLLPKRAPSQDDAKGHGKVDPDRPILGGSVTLAPKSTDACDAGKRSDETDACDAGKRPDANHASRRL